MPRGTMNQDVTTLRYEAIAKYISNGEPFNIEKLGNQLGSGPMVLYGLKNAGYLERTNEGDKNKQYRLLPEYADRLTADHIRLLRKQYEVDLRKRKRNNFKAEKQTKRRKQPQMAIVQSLPLEMPNSLDAFVQDYLRIKQLIGELNKLTNQ